jgi:hypothetical protein
MNKIKAAVDTSEYEDQYNFLNFRIDGFWLDEKLEEVYRGAGYKGLVPTLLFSLEGEEEKEVVWERILPATGEITICPLLMCPDDCNFSCTLIVAEIENWGDSIKWNRLGIDKSASSEPGKAGFKVDWFYKVGAMEFSFEEYVEMLQAFKKQFDEDEKGWEEKGS